MGVLRNKPIAKCSRLVLVQRLLMLVSSKKLFLFFSRIKMVTAWRLIRFVLGNEKQQASVSHSYHLFMLFPIHLFFYFLCFLFRDDTCIHTYIHTYTISEMFKFEVPSLTVGTLDTLMTLSDDLVKTDGVVEQTVRKIERTTAELFDRKSSDLTVGGKYN
jgi:hypothetical protein